MRMFPPRAARSRASAFVLALGALGLLAALAATARAESKILAKVDGAAITEDDYNDALADIGPGLPEKLEGPEREKYVLDYLIDLRLVAKQALADKLDGTADFARRLAYYHDKLAMEGLLTNVAKSATTEEAERKAYDEAAKAQPPEPEVHARHILLPTEEEAKAALARIKAGEDFAKVATELSKDPAGDGGDLGWFTKDRMVPEFADAAFKLEPGQVSDPVKSQFGWHIIKVEGKRMKTFPPFEQVKDQAARFVAQKAQTALITSLRDKAKIERFAEEAKPAEPAKPADPAPSTEPPKPKTP
ncbi:MAG: peptidylprolyl isomerase [Roseiarcus sp.]